MERWKELEQLGKLRADGLLTEEEFQSQKSRVLRSSPECLLRKLSRMEPQWPLVVVPLILLTITLLVVLA